MQPQSRPARRRGQGSLFVRKDSTGRETWYGKWWAPDGKQVKRALGRKRSKADRDGLTETKAEKELRRLMHEYRPPEPSEAATAVTVAEAAREHIDRVRTKGRKPSTIEHYESLLRTHVAPFMGDRPVCSVTRRDIEALMDHMRKPGDAEAPSVRKAASVKTVRLVLGFLHGVFEYARREGWVETNPCADVDKPTIPTSTEIRFLTVEEVEALLRAVPTFEDERAKRERNALLPKDEREREDPLAPVERVLYLTAAMTGLRQGELLGLRWRDVDFAAGRVRVVRNHSRHMPTGEFSTPKSGRSRSVPLAPRVATELDQLSRHTEYGTDDDLVFAHPQKGRPMDPSKVTKRFKAALARAGLRRMRFHDLRHTFGTTLAQDGVPIRSIQEWMGHRDHTTTLIYAHFAPSDREADQIAAAFSSASVHELQRVSRDV